MKNTIIIILLASVLAFVSQCVKDHRKECKEKTLMECPAKEVTN